MYLGIFLLNLLFKFVSKSVKFIFCCLKMILCFIVYIKNCVVAFLQFLYYEGFDLESR